MSFITKRGQRVEVQGRILRLTITRPFDNKFSISDQLYDMVQNGYILYVKVEGKEITITKDTKYLFREGVKTKFPGLPNWYRYVFAIPAKEEADLFSS